MHAFIYKEIVFVRSRNPRSSGGSVKADNAYDIFISWAALVGERVVIADSFTAIINAAQILS